MRGHALRESREPRRPFDNRPGSHPRQRRATGVEEEHAAPLPLVEAGPNLAGVQRYHAEGAPAHRHDALLGALAEEARDSLLVHDVLELEPHQLGHAGPGRIREPEQPATPPRQPPPRARRPPPPPPLPP